MIVDSSTTRGYSALCSLALLEAVRALDAHVPDELDEVHQELAVKRFGQSATVTAQIQRLERQARRAERVPAAELESLLKLVARRADAGLVFTDAGRRLGRHLIELLPVPGGLARLAGRRMGARALRTVDVRLTFGSGGAKAEYPDPVLTRATPDGTACALVGAAAAEVLRRLTDFDGAMMHVACRARGDAACTWHAALTEERS